MLVVEPTSIERVILIINKITESAKLPILPAKVFPDYLKIYTNVGRPTAAYT